jgi:hypothetical protein
MEKHFLNDHLPARRDCSHCVRAQTRSKPHRRIQHAENYTLSVDLSGKLSPGDDQETNGCRYFLVGCYDLPVTHDGASLLPVLGRDEAEDQPLPSLDEEVEGMAQHEAGDEQLLPEENEPMEEDVEEKMSRRRSRCTTPHGHRLHGGSGKECGAETTHFC